MFKILVLLLLHISKEHTDVDLTCDFYSSWAMGFKLMDKGGGGGLFKNKTFFANSFSALAVQI